MARTLFFMLLGMAKLSTAVWGHPDDDTSVSVDYECCESKCSPYDCNPYNCGIYKCNARECPFHCGFLLLETCYHTCYDICYHTCYETCYKTCCVPCKNTLNNTKIGKAREQAPQIIGGAIVLIVACILIRVFLRSRNWYTRALRIVEVGDRRIEEALPHLEDEEATLALADRREHEAQLLQSSKCKLRACKIAVVGSGSDGKTSLLNSLKGMEFQPETQSTRGAHLCEVIVSQHRWAEAGPATNEVNQYEHFMASAIKQYREVQMEQDDQEALEGRSPRVFMQRPWFRTCTCFRICSLCLVVAPLFIVLFHHLAPSLFHPFLASVDRLTIPYHANRKPMPHAIISGLSNRSKITSKSSPLDPTHVVTVASILLLLLALACVLRQCKQCKQRDYGQSGICLMQQPPELRFAEEGETVEAYVEAKRADGDRKLSYQWYFEAAVTSEVINHEQRNLPVPLYGETRNSLVLKYNSARHEGTFTVEMWSDSEPRCRARSRGMRLRTSRIGAQIEQLINQHRDALIRDHRTVTTIDFAGQRMYYTGFHIMLTDSFTIYIVTYDLTHDLNDKIQHEDTPYDMTRWVNLEFWLQSICSRAPHAWIVVACTKTDLVSKDMQKERTDKLWAKFRGTAYWNQILDVISISNKTGEGIPKLRATLEEQFTPYNEDERKGLRGYDDEVPLAWFKFASLVKLLSANGTKRISFANCLEIAHQCKIHNKGEVREMLRMFHDVGYLFWPSTPSLQDLVVLDVQWLMDSITALLCRRNIETMERGCPRNRQSWSELREGILSRNLLPDVWPDMASSERDCMLGYMELFGICLRQRLCYVVMALKPKMIEAVPYLWTQAGIEYITERDLMEQFDNPRAGDELTVSGKQLISVESFVDESFLIVNASMPDDHFDHRLSIRFTHKEQPGVDSDDKAAFLPDSLVHKLFVALATDSTNDHCIYQDAIDVKGILRYRLYHARVTKSLELAIAFDNQGHHSPAFLLSRIVGHLSELVVEFGVYFKVCIKCTHANKEDLWPLRILMESQHPASHVWQEIPFAWQRFVVPGTIKQTAANLIQLEIQALARRTCSNHRQFFPRVVFSYATGTRSQLPARNEAERRCETIDETGTGPGLVYVAALQRYLFLQGIANYSGLTLLAGEHWNCAFMSRVASSQANCKVLVCVLTKAFFRSWQCLEEVAHAVNHRVSLLPVFFEEVDLKFAHAWPNRTCTSCSFLSPCSHCTSRRKLALRALRVNRIPPRGTFTEDPNLVDLYLKSLMDAINDVCELQA